MTEQTWAEENILASDVWGMEKVITPLSDEEQFAKWEQAAAVLKNLGKLAETLWNDPLILAITDALVRAKEERARLEDKLSRLEGEELHSREHRRLKDLLHRADALSSALCALEREEWPAAENKAEYVQIVREMHGEADEAFARYRSEVGISG